MTARSRVLSALLTMLAVSAGVVVLAAPPVAASLWLVGDEAAFRSALGVASGDTTGPHTIQLTGDITLMGGTDPTYTGSQPLTIEGGGHVLSGNVARRVLQHSTSAPLTVNHIQVSNAVGGAIRASGPVTVTDAIFTNNTATAGGAISAAGTVTVTNSTFSYNTASGNAPVGGGGAIRSAASVTATGSTFTFNIAGGQDQSGDPHLYLGGGAITAGVSVTVTDSTLSYNTVTGSAFGGYYADGGAVNAPTVTVTGSTLTHNTATKTGGALFGETVTTTESTLADNSAVFGGGAIYAAAAVATDSTLTGNTGGAVYAIGPATAENSTFAGNTGPGISATSARLLHATVVGNTSSNGHNIIATSSIESFGSVVAEPPSGGTNCSAGAAVTSTYTFADDVSCGFDDATDGQAVGNDPQLQALGNNGGPTQTRAPQVTSPLVDAIPSAACDPAVLLDQRGLARPADGDVDGTNGCDIGAVEVQPPPARPDARIKRGSAGTLRGNNIYNTLTGQSVNGSAARGASVTYYASLQNDATFAERIRVQAQPSTQNFTVVYRNPAGTNITPAVTNGTYLTPTLPTGVTHPIKVVVTVRTAAPLNASLARTLTAFSTIRPTTSDTVRFTTSRS